MSTSWDVVVLGAGPAGAAAAISCARWGARVALVEREQFPRHAVGESLHPGVEPLLAGLGVARQLAAADFIRFPGHQVHWGKTEAFQAFGGTDDDPWLGYQAWRPTLDAILLEQARDLGVVVLQPATVVKLMRGPAAVEGVNTSQGPLPARFTLDATGRRGVLSRHLGLPCLRHRPTRLAWYGYARGQAADALAIPEISADPEGWTWTAQVRPQMAQWVRVNFNNRRPAPGWVAERLRGLIPGGLVPEGSPRGADVTPRMSSAPAGPGYFLLGDAAAVLDPLASHGVLRALMTGMYAAHLVGQVACGTAPAQTAAAHYRQWLSQWFVHDLTALDSLYDQLRTPAEESAMGHRQPQLEGLSHRVRAVLESGVGTADPRQHQLQRVYELLVTRRQALEAHPVFGNLDETEGQRLLPLPTSTP